MALELRLDPLDFAGRLPGFSEVVGVLEAEPGVGGAAECLLEADSQVGGDWRLAGADGGERGFLDLQLRCGLRHGQAQRLDAVLANGFTGMMWVAARQRQAARSIRLISQAFLRACARS